MPGSFFPANTTGKGMPKETTNFQMLADRPSGMCIANQTYGAKDARYS